MKKPFFLVASLLWGCTPSKVQPEKIGSSHPLYHLSIPLHPSFGISLEVLKDAEEEDFFLISERGLFSSDSIHIKEGETTTTIPAHLLKGRQKIQLDRAKFHEWIDHYSPHETILQIGSDLHLFVEIQPWIEQYKKLDSQYKRYQ